MWSNKHVICDNAKTLSLVVRVFSFSKKCNKKEVCDTQFYGFLKYEQDFN